MKNINMFLERTIEHWLDSVNELTYELSFNQILLSENYEIIHNSKHNAFEQGKDIIAQKNGKLFAFQLKGGNITSQKWRTEIKAEVEELVEYAVVHPSIPKGGKHESYLVTNGNIEDTVRLAIDNLNSNKWKKTPLRTLTKGQLLLKLIKISNNFIPNSLTDYKNFLDLYFSNGKELLDITKYEKFIKNVLQFESENISNEEKKRNIVTAVVFTCYIVNSFELNKNYISIIQCLTVLNSYILAIAEKNRLDEKYWFASFQIIWSKIIEASDYLEQEIIDDGFKKMINSIFDGEIGPYRKSLALSYLLSNKISQILQKNNNWNNILNENFWELLKSNLFIWGESALYSYILAFWLGKKQKNDEASLYFIQTPLETLIKYNGRTSQEGLLSPYYNIEFSLNKNLALLEDSFDDAFYCRSYLIKSITDLLARHNQRDILTKNWREITYIAQESFTPPYLWQNYLWHCNTGKDQAYFPKQTQSWLDLLQDAKKIEFERLPKLLQRHDYFIPFFLLVFPHRINSNVVKFLDELVFKEIF